MDGVFPFLEAFYHHFGGIGHLLVVVEKDFFADDFSDEEPYRFVGPLVFVEVWRRIGKEFLDAAKHHVHSETGFCRNGIDFGERQHLLPSCHQFFEFLGVAQVNLVDEQ